jgi:hypothetical protein
MSEKAMMVFLRIGGLYNPQLSEFKSNVERGAGCRVVTDSRSLRSFDPTLATLVVNSASLLVSSIALFFQILGSRSSEPTEEIVAAAISLAEQRLQLTMASADRELLYRALSMTQDQGAIEHNETHIRFVRTENLIEFEADLGISEGETHT